jgi:hypothetical protein
MTASRRTGKRSRRAGRVRRPGEPRSAAARLDAAEALFHDFRELTPFTYRPFVRSFNSWDAYDRWRRAQTNPWYR